MNPYYLNFTPGSEASKGGYIQTAQSIGQDSRVPSSLQGPVSEYVPTTSQQLYPVRGHDGHGSSSAPQTPGINLARSLRPSLGSGFIRTSSSPSSHPYHQARLNHIADRTSARHQECSRHPFPTVPAPVSGTVSSYDAVISNCASTRRHNSSQSPLVARKFAPALAFDSSPQRSIMPPNMNQTIPSFAGGFMVPRQTSLSTHETPTSLPTPYTLADEADVEYAQYRYGSKRCFYQCRFDISGSPCDKWIVGERTRVLRHLRSYHHLEIGPATPAFCRWDKCTHSRPMKQENLSRHVVMHLGVKWKCPHCTRLFSRDDAVHRHIERMVPGMDATDAEVVPGCEARAINEWQSKRARIA